MSHVASPSIATQHGGIELSITLSASPVAASASPIAVCSCMDAATLAKLAELTLKLGEVTERINSLTAALVQFALALAADAKTLNDANVAVDTLYKIFANSGMTDAQIKANSDYIQRVVFRDNAQRQFDATERNYLGFESD